MSIQRKRYKALFFISKNLDCSSVIDELDSYIVEDLFINGFIRGLKSNELGRGDEPIIYNLKISIKGYEFLESYNLFYRFKVFFNSTWIISIVSSVFASVVAYYISIL